MKYRLLALILLTLIRLPGTSQDLYDINRINTIEIPFQEPDWDQILDNLKSGKFVKK